MQPSLNYFGLLSNIRDGIALAAEMHQKLQSPAEHAVVQHTGANGSMIASLPSRHLTLYRSSVGPGFAFSWQ